MRKLKEWHGATDDTSIPARVKVRVFDRCNGRCCECGVVIVGAIRPEFDHATAIINGGENRETNIRLLCKPCHSVKSKSDVAQKATTYRKRAKHLGLKPKGRPFPGSKASGLRKRMNGQVEKRT